MDRLFLAVIVGGLLLLISAIGLAPSPSSISNSERVLLDSAARR
jgi:hypothetical protein